MVLLAVDTLVFEKLQPMVLRMVLVVIMVSHEIIVVTRALKILVLDYNHLSGARVVILTTKKWSTPPSDEQSHTHAKKKYKYIT